MYGFGSNEYGQLGNKNSSDVWSPELLKWKCKDIIIQNISNTTIITE